MNLNEIKLVVQAQAHMREIMDERQRAHDAHHAAERQALQLQAAEYERRLEHLNNNLARADARDAQYVPREAFDAFRETLESRNEERMKIVAQRLTAIQALSSRREGGLGALVGAVGVGAALAGVVALLTR